MSKPRKIILIIDHGMVGLALKRMLESEGGATVKLVAPGALSGAKISGSGCDAAIIYVPESLHELVEIIEIAKKRVSANILVVSARGDASPLAEAGARGALRSGADAEALRAALEKVASGEMAFDDDDMQRICDARLDGAGEKKLSKREKEVIARLASGLSASETAKELGIALSTVETHRVRIYKKLKLRNLADLTRYAMRENQI